MSDTPAPRPVTATYRLQLHREFTFADAAAQVPYLTCLGVSHLYLSPVLTAVPGSPHGYDVLDHRFVNPELGGEDGFRSLAATAREHGLGLIVDIVPNHMAFLAPQWANGPAWELLRMGRDSVAASWFDVDWGACGGRFGLPILGHPLADVLSAGELSLDIGRPEEGPAAGHPVIRYHDHVLPVAPGTEGEDVEEVLLKQNYVLQSWRDDGFVMNYRRFFEVDSLIGVRVERRAVFEATHRKMLQLHYEGLIDGFRVDHPDGLADPEAYLTMLAAACRPGTPIWVEKIIEGSERLPDAWRCAGTTGYDALAPVQQALVDPAGSAAVEAAWATVDGEPDFRTVMVASKRQVIDDLLQPELRRLLRRAQEALPDADPEALGAAVHELLVHIEVYRAYIRPGYAPTAQAVHELTKARDDAAAARPELTEVLHRLTGVLLHPDDVRAGAEDTPPWIGDPARDAAHDLAVRFQQVCGPVMAKGIEDTAFYRYHRLVALNEVGGDPRAATAPDVEPLHVWAEHQQRYWPLGLTCLSTHDTKRSEDVRARLLACAGDAEGWAGVTEVFAAAAAAQRVRPQDGQLLWQTLAGVGRVDPDRLEEYLLKALREAKDETAWIDGDEVYEARMVALGDRALDDPGLIGAVEALVARNEQAVQAATLGAKALQLTLPGVPDTYQGTELVALSLVDPDNRRPVDFAVRAQRLARLDAGAFCADLDDQKLLVTSRLLRLRREHPEWFGPGAAYLPLRSSEGSVAGFRRGDRVATLAVRARRATTAGYGQESVPLPPGTWKDVLTGAVHEVTDPARLADLLAIFPVAVLVREA